MTRQRKPVPTPFTMADAQAIIDANRGFRLLWVKDDRDRKLGVFLLEVPYDIPIEVVQHISTYLGIYSVGFMGYLNDREHLGFVQRLIDVPKWGHKPFSVFEAHCK